MTESEAMAVAEAARKLAEEAKASAEASSNAIAAHERVCSERYINIAANLSHIGKAIEKLDHSKDLIWGRIWMATGSLILILFAVVGFLYTKAS